MELSIPAMMRNSVDLPAPLRPSTPTTDGAAIEAERRLRVAQDHFVAGRDETSHFVHGVDYKRFIYHSGVILPYVF